MSTPIPCNRPGCFEPSLWWSNRTDEYLCREHYGALPEDPAEAQEAERLEYIKLCEERFQRTAKQLFKSIMSEEIRRLNDLLGDYRGLEQMIFGGHRYAAPISLTYPAVCVGVYCPGRWRRFVVEAVDWRTGFTLFRRRVRSKVKAEALGQELRARFSNCGSLERLP